MSSRRPTAKQTALLDLVDRGKVFLVHVRRGQMGVHVSGDPEHSYTAADVDRLLAREWALLDEDNPPPGTNATRVMLSRKGSMVLEDVRLRKMEASDA